MLRKFAEAFDWVRCREEKKVEPCSRDRHGVGSAPHPGPSPWGRGAGRPREREWMFVGASDACFQKKLESPHVDSYGGLRAWRLIGSGLLEDVEGVADAGAEAEAVTESPGEFGEGPDLIFGEGGQGRGRMSGHEEGFSAEEIARRMCDDEKQNDFAESFASVELFTENVGEGRASKGGAEPFAFAEFQSEPAGGPDDRVNNEGRNKGLVELSARVWLVCELHEEEFGEYAKTNEAPDEDGGFTELFREKFRSESPKAKCEQADECKTPGSIENRAHR